MPSIDALFSAEDVLVYKDGSNPTWMWGTEVTEVDGRYLMLSVTKDTSRVRSQTVYALGQ